MTTKVGLVNFSTQQAKYYEQFLTNPHREVSFFACPADASLAIEKEVHDLLIVQLTDEKDNYPACLELIQLVRDQAVQTGIIAIVNATHVSARLEALRLGVDEVLTENFQPEELEFYVNRLVTQNVLKMQKIITSSFQVDLGTGKVSGVGFEDVLRRKEYQLLSLLWKNKNCIVSKEKILERLWTPEETPLLSTIDVHIRRLRLKIHDDQKKVILTVYGLGYVFVN